MGVLYDVCKSIECKMCGCIMDATHDGDICECCLDDLHESDQDKEGDI